jgi:hypothetical protein
MEIFSRNIFKFVECTFSEIVIQSRSPRAMYIGVGQSEMGIVCSITMFITEILFRWNVKDLYINNKRPDVPQDTSDMTHVILLAKEG